MKAPYFTGEYHAVWYLLISQFHNGSKVKHMKLTVFTNNTLRFQCCTRVLCNLQL